jgi:hypothetical protein
LGTAAAFGGQRTASHLERGVAETIEPDNLAAEAKIASLTLLARSIRVGLEMASGHAPSARVCG